MPEPSVGIVQSTGKAAEKSPKRGAIVIPKQVEPERTFFNHGTAKCLFLAIAVCVVIAVVVPTVCLRHGCGRTSGGSQPEDSINRLIVNFDTIGKTVKSIVPPLLYDYLEEQFLQSSGIQVVTFPDSNVLAQVRKIIQAQPDLANLLQDRMLVAPPITDALLSSTGGDASQRLLRGLPDRRALQAGATGVNYEDQLWQMPVVNYSGAWSLTEGVPSVVVAVIDTGCDLSHPDLRDNLWINTKEVPNNQQDDDGNGYVDDVYGYDFAGNCPNDWRSSNNSGCGALPNPQDPRSHGTHCAGIVAALRNSYGVVGVAPKVKVMCLKVAATSTGGFFPSHVYKAFDYALRMGAHVVSCSFGPNEPNTNPTPEQREALWTEARLYRTALAPLVQKNMLIVAAAGNEHYVLDQLDRVNSTYNPCFQARDFPDNMLCVMATDEQDKGWYEVASNVVFGTNNSTKYVDIAAPGRQILSTVPPLSDNGGVYYAIKTGSSMATPMVAGAGALVLSILGARDGNFYQGAAARRILLESATVLPGLPTRGSSRLNVSAAVRQAKASLTGMKVLALQAGFSEGDQTVMMAGFNETYYPGDIGFEELDFSRLTPAEATVRAGASRFEAYKLGAGYTLVARASVRFNQSGIYSINVSTTAAASDLVIRLGQSVIAPFNAPVALSVDTPGWYAFQLRYRNPVAAVDIRLAEPGSSLTAADFKYLGVFFTATTNPPRHLYYAPSITLSSAFQVLTRPNTSAIRRDSVLDGPFPQLQLDQPFTFSSVLHDVNFTDPNAALRDALYPAASGAGPPPASVLGIVHTRIRPPEVAVRFRVTCQLCSLTLNTLQVLDVYDPLGSSAAVSTRVSSCVTLGRGAGTHDLTLRFALPDTAAAPLSLTWVPCDSPSNVQAVSITTHVASNVLWRPSSGVAGYVPGVQCDLWPDPLAAPGKVYPYTSQPLLKFRLPFAAAQTAKGAVTLAAAGCQAASESFASNCSAPLSFRLQDIFPSIPMSTFLLAITPLASVNIRCFTYVNRGFGSGGVQVRPTGINTIYTFLGSQSVYRSDAVAELQGPYNAASLAASQTSLQGYYQLLAIEWRAVPTTATFALLDGLSSGFLLDTRNTLLPIPVVAQRQPVKVAVAAAPAASPPPPVRSPSPASSSRPGRGLQQAAVSASGYAPVALGSSAWEYRQVGPAGLTGVFYRPNRTAPSEALPGMASVVVNNLTGSGVQAVVAAAGGLTGTVAGPAVNASLPSRYMRADGFLLSPTSEKGGVGAMGIYVLRVRDGDSQSMTVNMGNVTVRNAVEFPARAVTETRVELMLPAGYVPMLVTVKSSRPDGSVALDVGVITQATGKESAVDSTMWFSNTDSTFGKQ